MDTPLPVGLYRKPSGAIAAYPTIRVESDPSLQGDAVRETGGVRYVSQAVYDQMLARAIKA